MEEDAFTSSIDGSSVTKTCAVEKRNVLGINVAVIDTPGLYDTYREMTTILDEICRFAWMSAPGPHAFLLALSVERLTAEVQNTIRIFLACLGEEIKRYMIVVFTNADRLIQKRKRIRKSIEAFVKEIEIEYIQKVLEECEGRYVAFNNDCEPDSEENKKQVNTLLDMVNEVVSKNEGHFSNEIFQKVEAKRQERLKVVLQQIEEEQKKMIDDIKKNYVGEARRLQLERAQTQRENKKRDADLEIRKESTNPVSFKSFKESISEIIKMLRDRIRRLIFNT